MKIISVVGARPNFIKISPFIKAIDLYNSTHSCQIKNILVHTGQHYDDRMSECFFKSLSIPKADINLGIGSGTNAEQIGNTMIEFEKVLISEKPDWVVVVGDVNATIASSIVAREHNIKVCHIEAGLRSGDMQMPEEINRLLTDHISDLLLTPDILSRNNLIKEGIADSKICFVGNIMIDTLEANREKAEHLSINKIIEKNALISHASNNDIESYAVLTLHRPSNVDNRGVLESILQLIIEEIALEMPIIWPIHPRTEKMLKQFDLWPKVAQCPALFLLHPIGYHEMLRLNMSAALMITDSGGLQEECCILGTPCLTLRWNTERPVTLKEHGGSSVLVGNNIDLIRQEYQKAKNSYRVPRRPELWDGKTASRCLAAIIAFKS